MQAHDIDAVVAVIDSQDDDDAQEALKSYQRTDGVVDQFVLEHAGKIIGVTGFETPPGCDATHWLSWTYVHDEHANQGHGRKMLGELIDQLKSNGGRKLFIKVSDYVDEDDGAIYAAALHLYQSLGFEIELTHDDYYSEGEAQIILGLRLAQNKTNFGAIDNEACAVQFNSVFEINETDDAYSFGWQEGDSVFSLDDVKIGLEQVRNDNGRAVFLSFPTNFLHISETLYAAGFSNSGVLNDYYEDGIDEQHYTYRFNN